MTTCRSLITTSCLITFLLVATRVSASGQGKSVVDTPHNLSASGAAVSGPSNLWSPTEGRVCIFCHTPHHATGEGPLWSRALRSGDEYTTYAGATVVAGKPNLASRLCLSCHDGTIALGHLGGPGNTFVADASLGQIPFISDPRQNSMLGIDLSDDHPISFGYPYVEGAELQSPEYVRNKGVKLFGATGSVECSSCHDPHNNSYGKFLVTATVDQHDALCTICHKKTGWVADSAHMTGGSLQEVKDTITRDGCINCHIPHNAAGAVPLLKKALAEENCYSSCHRSSPYLDIRSEFLRTYKHPVSDIGAIGRHQVNESLPVSTDRKHVQCVDCHNPHQAGLTAPGLPAALRGVRGMTETGVAMETAQMDFQICFKCHGGDYANDFGRATIMRPSRKVETFKENLRFVLRNPSFHPVVEERRGNGRSLLQEYQATMRRISCSDCHARHGSDFPYILTGKNDDNYPTTSSAAADYPLCFKCHSADFLLVPSMAPHAPTAALHKAHLIDHGSRVPCSVCHDPHGVAADMGGTVAQNSHLINFDRRFAGDDPLYDSTILSCSCTVMCHSITPPVYTTKTRTFTYN